MTKIEYIKILREVQNELKKQMIDYSEFKRLHPRPTDEAFERDKMNCIKRTFMYTILTFSSYSLDWPTFISTLLIIITLYNILYSTHNDKLNDEIIENYIVMDEIFNNWETENEKIENCIKFFNETSKEDIDRYLSYKNNFTNL